MSVTATKSESQNTRSRSAANHAGNFVSEDALRAQDLNLYNSNNPNHIRLRQSQRAAYSYTCPAQALQAKLNIGQAPNAIADQVIAKPSALTTTDDTEKEMLQAKCAACETAEQEDKISKKDDHNISPDIQKKASAQHSTGAEFESRVKHQKGNGQPLPRNIQREMEAKMGADLSSVKIHTDNQAVQLSRDINAQAFTHGSDVYFNEGKYNTASQVGKHLLAHELAHTVQQGGASINQGAASGMVQKLDDPQVVADRAALKEKTLWDVVTSLSYNLAELQQMFFGKPGDKFGWKNDILKYYLVNRGWEKGKDEVPVWAMHKFIPTESEGKEKDLLVVHVPIPNALGRQTAFGYITEQKLLSLSKSGDENIDTYYLYQGEANLAAYEAVSTEPQLLDDRANGLNSHQGFATGLGIKQQYEKAKEQGYTGTFEEYEEIVQGEDKGTKQKSPKTLPDAKGASNDVIVRCDEWKGWQVRVEKEMANKWAVWRYIRKGCCNYFGFRMKIPTGKGSLWIFDTSSSVRGDIRGVLDDCHSDGFVEGAISGELKLSYNLFKAEVANVFHSNYSADLSARGIPMPSIKDLISGIELNGTAALLPTVSAKYKSGTIIHLQAFCSIRVGIELKLPAGFKVTGSYDVAKCTMWKGDFDVKTGTFVNSEWPWDCKSNLFKDMSFNFGIQSKPKNWNPFDQGKWYETDQSVF